MRTRRRIENVRRKIHRPSEKRAREGERESLMGYRGKASERVAVGYANRTILVMFSITSIITFYVASRLLS